MSTRPISLDRSLFIDMMASNAVGNDPSGPRAERPSALMDDEL